MCAVAGETSSAGLGLPTGYNPMADLSRILSGALSDQFSHLNELVPEETLESPASKSKSTT